ncbi:hypothetical protein SAMN04488117_10170 [Celeribacter baekdonensis]|uniref:Uncharacterized protein n=1 Tax=Celeribacter baekdonensis TaxID=875171 RepID=A0A1G7FG48_9RHOB|nr:hypothetical protein [Celeribacter baekdonensis]SDE74837.1 hypothetical protein SAMN04488117_10170 [Celeribacter baekdonensis]
MSNNDPKKMKAAWRAYIQAEKEKVSALGTYLAEIQGYSDISGASAAHRYIAERDGDSLNEVSKLHPLELANALSNETARLLESFRESFED